MKSSNSAAELAELKAINAQLHEDNRVAKDAILKLKNEIESLKEQFRLFQHQRFAKDRAVPVQQSDLFFNEAEMAAEAESTTGEETGTDEVSSDSATVKGYTRRRGGRRPLPEHLPRVDVIHDLPESEKVCPQDGRPLERIGEEVSEQPDIIPAKIQVIRHIRIKYGCRVSTATHPDGKTHSNNQIT